MPFAIPCPFADPRFLVMLASMVLWTFMMARCDMPALEFFDQLFHLIGLKPISQFIRFLGMTFSLSKSHQKSELAEFTKMATELDRRCQRYLYFAETIDELNPETGVHSLNEVQKVLLTTATKQLEILPRKVHELAQLVEDYLHATRHNVWVRNWIATYPQRHHWSDRAECIRRLGCCAATCGCCYRRREIPAHTDVGPDETPGKRFMRMAMEGLLGNCAHCSIDCGCCIRRRGFSVTAESEGDW